ncbi:MAG: hypothetical protein QN716_06325 [Nitrososphaeraceae archaeon]|jgi:hypothetical protein|nr:hypothetical protein [Nitrososphaeraceae archaeon]
MSGKDGLVEREIKTESQRTFTLKCVLFENGLFIVVAEGANRIGSLTVSISSSNKSNTATVIPNRYNSMFINTISEKVSSMVNGICVVSLYNAKQLNLEDMKAIMGEIMNIIGGKLNGEDKKTALKGFQ